MAYRLEHPADLLVATLADHYFHPGRVPAAILADYPRAGRQGLLAKEGHAGAQLGHGVRVRDAAHFGHVNLGDPVARMGHLLSKRPVVGEDEQPFRLRVQASDRMEPGHRGVPAAEALLQRRDHQLHHRVRNMGIVTRGHVTLGFV